MIMQFLALIRMHEGEENFSQDMCDHIVACKCNWFRSYILLIVVVRITFWQDAALSAQAVPLWLNGNCFQAISGRHHGKIEKQQTCCKLYY